MSAVVGWDAEIADLARVGRDAVARGLALASGGNLSIRRGNEFVVSARGSYLDRLDASTVAVLDLAGRLVGGSSPSTEWKLHHRTYLERPDVHAIVHVHPQHTVLLDALGKPIRLLTLDHVAYVGAVARVPFHPNGSDELADAAAVAARGCDCVVLGFHGSSTLGAAIDSAYRKALNLESAAEATYRMLLLGDETTEFPPELRATAIHPTADPAPADDLDPSSTG